MANLQIQFLLSILIFIFGASAGECYKTLQFSFRNFKCTQNNDNTYNTSITVEIKEDLYNADFQPIQHYTISKKLNLNNANLDKCFEKMGYNLQLNEKSEEQSDNDFCVKKSNYYNIAKIFENQSGVYKSMKNIDMLKIKNIDCKAPISLFKNPELSYTTLHFKNNSGDKIKKHALVINFASDYKFEPETIKKCKNDVYELLKADLNKHNGIITHRLGGNKVAPSFMMKI